MRRHRGIALVTAILLAMFALVIGLSVLTFVQTDARLSRRSEVELQAYGVPVMGLEYYKQCQHQYPNPTAGSVVSISPTQSCVIDVDAAGVTVTGRVHDPSGIQVVAQRRLKATDHRFPYIVDMSQ